MTVDQIKDKIEIEIDEEDYGVRLLARLSLGATCTISRDVLRSALRSIDLLEEAKEELRMTILRTLFADQGTALRAAIYDFLSAPPPWISGPGGLVDRKLDPFYLKGAVLAAARWQPDDGKLEPDPKALGDAWERGRYRLDVEQLRGLIESKNLTIESLTQEVKDLRWQLKAKDMKEKEVAG